MIKTLNFKTYCCKSEESEPKPKPKTKPPNPTIRQRIKNLENNRSRERIAIIFTGGKKMALEDTKQIRNVHKRVVKSLNPRYKKQEEEKEQETEQEKPLDLIKIEDTDPFFENKD